VRNSIAKHGLTFKKSKPMRVVILGSGRGSNAEAILMAQQSGNLGTAEVVHIFSDRADAKILELGNRFGVPSTYVDPSPYKTKLEGPAEERMIDSLNRTNADLVVLAGFMRVLKLGLLTAFSGKIINLHPSLLPSFPGLDAISQAWRRGVKITGCTVHCVTGDVDGGPILDQTAVRVESADTVETLAAKVHAAEHELLPRVIAQLSHEFEAKR
jgi:phosphoribosylglycinamide formyltransferase 1